MGKVLKRAACAGLVLATAAGLFVGGALWGFREALPTPRQLLTAGAELDLCVPDPKPAFVPLAEIPLPVRGAFLAVEDSKLMERPAVNPLLQITLVALSGRRAPTGAMSQSLAHCLLSPWRGNTLAWHAAVAWTDWRLLRDLPRERLLEAYLNAVYLGRGAYGIGAAAQAYCGKAPKDLNLAEAAMLAGLPKAPAYLAAHPPLAAARRDHVLDAMVANGFVTADEAAMAKTAPSCLPPEG